MTTSLALAPAHCFENAGCSLRIELEARTFLGPTDWTVDLGVGSVGLSAFRALTSPPGARGSAATWILLFGVARM